MAHSRPVHSGFLNPQPNESRPHHPSGLGHGGDSHAQGSKHGYSSAYGRESTYEQSTLNNSGFPQQSHQSNGYQGMQGSHYGGPSGGHHGGHSSGHQSGHSSGHHGGQSSGHQSGHHGGHSSGHHGGHGGQSHYGGHSSGHHGGHPSGSQYGGFNGSQYGGHGGGGSHYGGHGGGGSHYGGHGGGGNHYGGHGKYKGRDKHKDYSKYSKSSIFVPNDWHFQNNKAGVADLVARVAQHVDKQFTKSMVSIAHDPHGMFKSDGRGFMGHSGARARVGSKSIPTICPRCQSQIVTLVKRRPDAKNALATAGAVALSLILDVPKALLPLALLPMQLKSLHKISHYCPRCNYKLGKNIKISIPMDEYHD
ncbi:hypothetical protein IW146_002726 [Coemansia sp. RSA 922]|nr:hypothetical protein GGH13_007600 [Coemansia sp. S155-1]KAJ2114889.1 hypothetical protein IW146_002726 [Coemansia sp. RSA 922]